MDWLVGTWMMLLKSDDLEDQNKVKPNSRSAQSLELSGVRNLVFEKVLH